MNSEQISDRIVAFLSDADTIDPDDAMKGLLYVLAGICCLQTRQRPKESAEACGETLLELVAIHEGKCHEVMFQ